jgi:hypothetical protein
MRTLLITIALVGFGCSDDKKPAVDAAVQIDAPVDAVVLPALDCPTYCAQIQANCTGANAQYPDMAHCTATCAAFTVGTSKVTDTSGNTLGCRIYHAGDPAKTAPATHCVHAGPGGDSITAATPAYCSGGDVCQNFCALEIKACGTADVPLTGNPKDANNNPLYQYQNMGACMTACVGFDKTHAYSTTAAGNSLACRLYHTTNAVIAVTPNGATHCAHTASGTAGAGVGPCSGTATP